MTLASAGREGMDVVQKTSSRSDYPCSWNLSYSEVAACLYNVHIWGGGGGGGGGVVVKKRVLSLVATGRVVVQ